jgi:hypothetical protein
MAYYDINVLLALPSGPCTCPSKDCVYHTITSHSERVGRSMSRWTSPNSRVDDANMREARFGSPAECVTIHEGKDVPNESDRWIFDLVNGAPRSRLTIFGHGDNKSTNVGGRSPEELAKLIKVGCRIKRVTKISLLACYGGGNLDTAKGQEGHVTPSGSFAKQFHAHLALACEGIQLFVDLSARTRAMTTDVNSVRKALMPNGEEVKTPETKYLFFWVDTLLEGQQLKEQKKLPWGKLDRIRG